MRNDCRQPLPEGKASEKAKASAGRVSQLRKQTRGMPASPPAARGSAEDAGRAGRYEKAEGAGRAGRHGKAEGIGRAGGHGKAEDAGRAGRHGKEKRNGRERELPDYTVYRFSGKELAKYLALYALLDGCVSYLFFYSRIAFLLLLPGAVLFLRDRRQSLKTKRAREMTRQFLDGIQMIAASLQAGYSAENSLREALRELRKIYGPDTFIVREFCFMDAQIEMSRSLEELFCDFGRRCAIEDIRSFSEVLLTAKRSGGDLLAIIRNTASCIRQKQETMQEIETCLSGKVMEQNIMSLIPILILAYIKLSSPEFLSAMYGNATGTTVMGGCFAVYVAAYFWGRRIVRIEV